MIYVVLGMHKSGTTLVSQILHHSGVNMDDDLDESVSYDKGNKYERQSILHLNMDILGVNDYQVIDLAAPERPEASAEQRARMDRIVADCVDRYEDWGFKDPRACLVYPLWDEALPEHKIIVVYRHPSQLWKRFAGHSLLGSYKMPFSAWKYLNRWYEHNMNIIDYLKSTPHEYLVLSYTELMSSDDEFARLQGFVDCELVDRRRKDLFRSRNGSNLLLRVAERMLKMKRGHSVEEVLVQLDAFRR